jgi:hypothetical protein
MPPKCDVAPKRLALNTVCDIHAAPTAAMAPSENQREANRIADTSLALKAIEPPLQKIGLSQEIDVLQTLH